MRTAPEIRLIVLAPKLLTHVQEEFQVAADSVKNLKKMPTDAELLELYALFKQAKVGDVNTGP